MANAKEIHFRPPWRPGEVPPSYVPVRVSMELQNIANKDDPNKMAEDENIKPKLTKWRKRGLYVGLIGGVSCVVFAYLSRHKDSVYLGENGVVFEAETVKPPKKNKRKKGK